MIRRTELCGPFSKSAHFLQRADEHRSLSDVYGWLSKLWSLFGILVKRVPPYNGYPKRGPDLYSASNKLPSSPYTESGGLRQ